MIIPVQVSRVDPKTAGTLPSLLLDYLAQKKPASRLTPWSPDLESLKKAIEQRAVAPINRTLLTAALQKQYAKIPDRELINSSIDALNLPDTFCVVTSHQPNLLLGPAYFIYKTLSAIVYARHLGEQFPQYRFVPLFWLGSDDHDFEELSFINLFGRRLSLTQPPEGKGPFGRLSGLLLKEIWDDLQRISAEAKFGRQTLLLLREAYGNNRNMGQAAQFLLHQLFGSYGLVVVNQDDQDLKRAFLPIIKEELFRPVSEKLVMEQARLIEPPYKLQAQPRSINLFYISPEGRLRIERHDEAGKFRTADQSLTWTAEELETELENSPEKFSPNVFLRPLMQESLVPGVAYVGGGGELSYWMELPKIFEHFKVPFPVLLPRHSAFWVEAGSARKMKRLGIRSEDFFQEQDAIVNRFVRNTSAEELSLASEIAELEKIFQRMEEKAERIDASLLKSVKAEAQKQANAIRNLESKLLRAEKNNYQIAIGQIRGLFQKLHPENTLQERYDNFLTWYLRLGPDWFETLLEHFKPFDFDYLVFQE